MRTLVCSLLLVFTVVAGCGPGRNKVEGKIVKDGKPYALSEKGVFVLSFTPEAGDQGKT